MFFKFSGGRCDCGMRNAECGMENYVGREGIIRKKTYHGLNGLTRIWVGWDVRRLAGRHLNGFFNIHWIVNALLS